jgi:hypothetical protein
LQQLACDPNPHPAKSSPHIRIVFDHHPLFNLCTCLIHPSDIFCSVSLSQISCPFVVLPVYIALPNHLVSSMTSGFRHGVNDIVALLGKLNIILLTE